MDFQMTILFQLGDGLIYPECVFPRSFTVELMIGRPEVGSKYARRRNIYLRLDEITFVKIFDIRYWTMLKKK